MNREDIIRMANESLASDASGIDFVFSEKELMNFAALIAEDCAKRCDDVAALHEKHREHGRAYGAYTAAIAIRGAYKP